MSRAEKAARWYFFACGVSLLGLIGAIAAVTHSLWSLFSVIPFACLYAGGIYLNAIPFRSGDGYR